MGGGGLVQLVAYGAQDIYLTGQPQITYFKSVFRRYTSFAIDSIMQPVAGILDYGNLTSFIVDRNGDLLSDVYLEIPRRNDYDVTSHNYQPFYLIDYTELEIGGQVVSKVYGEWMLVWSSLALRRDSWADPLEGCLTLDKNADYAYLPLMFWFHNNPGLAIPLIALQYHEVKVNIRFNSLTALETIFNSSTGWWNNYSIPNIKVYCDYVYLDTVERKEFTQKPHEYLIEQTQLVKQEASTNDRMSINLNFNHPVKSLIWYGTQYGNSIFSSEPYETAKIVLNGTDRFKERPRAYFEKYQVYRHWSGLTPWYRNLGYGIDQNGPNNIYLSTYSFCLRPTEHQPSGTLNFSRIKTGILELTNINKSDQTGFKEIKVWAHNYNILRIMSGMGGLAYSN